MGKAPQVILLVEDSEDDADLTHRAFQRHAKDCILLRASDGQEALDYLFLEGKFKNQKPTSLPALVLLDLKLPCLNGLEVLRSLRANSRTRHLPVVVLSCSGEQKDIESSYELGANSYLRKPIDFDEFIMTIEILIRYWLQTNEPVRSGEEQG
jgi:two-component system response regulator